MLVARLCEMPAAGVERRVSGGAARLLGLRAVLCVVSVGLGSAGAVWLAVLVPPVAAVAWAVRRDDVMQPVPAAAVSAAAVVWLGVFDERLLRSLGTPCPWL